MSVSQRRCCATSASSSFSQYWKKSYGDVIEASRNTAPFSDLPIFLPSRVSSSGEHIANAGGSSPSSRPTTLRISSSPAVMLPHWSAPPICISTPRWRKSCRKSADWRVMYENSVNDMPPGRGRLHRILRKHVRDREMLADVAQEVEQPPFGQPFPVV